jgi:uncharacterized membrane protein (DUF4010 family)
VRRYHAGVTRYEPFASLAVATAAGLLIGLERERSAPEQGRSESFLGGARTHPMFALVGGVSTLVARQLGAAALVVPAVALVLLLGENYAGDVVRDRHRGITSEAAFLLSFFLGALALTEGVIEPFSAKALAVSAVAVVATFLLSAKPMLHPAARRVTASEATAILEFLLVAVVVLPFLPDRTYGPLDVLNPFQIGVFMVVISGISFIGYAGIRLLGPARGLGFTGLVGGLVSSTAVTLSMAGRAKERPELEESAALAVILASTIMFVRILVLVAFVNPGLERDLVWPMAGGAAGGVGASIVLWRRSRSSARGPVVPLSNPFELSQALKFALAFAVILLGSKAASVYLGTAGTYAAGVLAGTADVDPLTLSMAKLAGHGVKHDVAATTIFLAAASNTAVKGGMAVWLGGWSFGRKVLAGQAAMLAGGTLGVILAWVL